MTSWDELVIEMLYFVRGSSAEDAQHNIVVHVFHWPCSSEQNKTDTTWNTGDWSNLGMGLQWVQERVQTMLACLV